LLVNRRGHKPIESRLRAAEGRSLPRHARWL
jgi:hypothetical protein